jgi:hypothetical protein
MRSTFAPEMRTYSLSLTIEADDTSRFSDVLGILADPSPNRNPRHRARHWRHYFVRDSECNIDDEITKALERCRPFQADFLNWAESGAYIELFVGIFLNTNASFAIRPQNLSLAGRLGFHFGFDYYPRSNRANKGRQATASPSPAT